MDFTAIEYYRKVKGYHSDLGNAKSSEFSDNKVIYKSITQVYMSGATRSRENKDSL